MGNIGKPKISKLIDFEESEKESVSIEMGNSENVLGDYSENELVIVKMVSVEIEKSKPKLVRNSYKLVRLRELTIILTKSSIFANIAEQHSTENQI